jgi:CubicO group peptidase (beta-lactamase class C family)
MTAVASEPTVTVPGVSRELEAFIEEERRRADVTGAAVAAFDRDGLRFSQGFGYADLERGERVTPETLFRAASISKLFTTTLVLQEVERGRLALDAPVNQYLDPEYRIRETSGTPADDVTIRHLLTHTSGLPVSWRGLDYGPLWWKLIANNGLPPESLEDVVKGMRAIRGPGKRIVYANGGFSLLGHLAAQLNATPFRDLVRERVLRPLGMLTSDFPLDPYGPGIATPYGPTLGIGGAGRHPVRSIKNRTGPAGALLTSALELSRFGRMVLRGGELDGEKLLSEMTLDEATRMQAVNQPALDDGWGLGFAVSAYRGRRMAWHTGGLAGVATRIDTFPDDGVGVVVLTNGGDAWFVGRIADRLRQMVLGLEPEVVPGSPAGMTAGSEAEWQAFGVRASGRYKLLDVVPPGLMKRIMPLVARPRVSHVSDGILAVEGIGREPAFLYPDGELGQYRLASPIMYGIRAVIEEKANGTHLWASIMHLYRSN